MSRAQYITLTMPNYIYQSPWSSFVQVDSGRSHHDGVSSCDLKHVLALWCTVFSFRWISCGILACDINDIPHHRAKLNPCIPFCFTHEAGYSVRVNSQ